MHIVMESMCTMLELATSETGYQVRRYINEVLKKQLGFSLLLIVKCKRKGDNGEC